jgi:hypothetical protein
MLALSGAIGTLKMLFFFVLLTLVALANSAPVSNIYQL